MQEKKYTYNGEKENAVFAVKLRGLFEDRKNTHRELAEYIEEVTGESVTRQAIGQWCNGNTCPNLKTVPIIAEFFGVSCDYLLTDTEIETADIEIQAICEYTGLSVRAIKRLAHDFSSEAVRDWAGAASRIIEKGFLDQFAIEMSELEDKSKYISNTFSNFSHIEIVRLADELNLSHGSFADLLIKKTTEYEANVPKPYYSNENDSTDVIFEQCDLNRYRLMQYAEKISDMFDHRKDWQNYTRKQLLEYLNITEDQLKELRAEAKRRAERRAEHGNHNPPKE